MSNTATATLFVVATPIGNLEDITYRAVRTLREVDAVAAEDTRSAQFLLGHFGIPAKPLLSVFEGNEARRSEEILSRLTAGQSIALISEAGLPGVSDPGQRVVAAVIAAGHRVEVIPGASAALTALVASGLPTDRFLFVGFPPRDDGPRRELAGRLRVETATMIFYEAPPRVGATLADLAAAFGPSRPAALARELTKLHEEIVRAPLGELAEKYKDTPPRGECTIVVAGASEEEAHAAAMIDVEAEVRALLAQGIPAKEIAARLALATGKPRRQIYQLALALGAGK
jgi:16S rRNA (cytidine1402-2'-O)-methyltransferase